MKIVVQNFKSGVLSVSAVPPPSLSSGSVLVRAHASLISSGTDRAIIGLGRKSYLGKALDRPDLARKVVNRARTDGLWPTYKVVKNLISEPIPLGYSLVGSVVRVGRDVHDIAVGDRVAAAGLGHANHAELVAVPRNLLARVPDEVADDQAAYVTIGAIAMHGLRQADQQIGATLLIVGLGLVGLIGVQIAAAAGLRVVGLDIDPAKVDLARANGAAAAFVATDPQLEAAVRSMTAGYGADATLLTAASRDAGEKIFDTIANLSRDRARVVVVGDVKMQVSRRAYFEKELEILQSRSYGPGRYDDQYELKGYDYPIGYIRWTERRNMESFLQLIADKKLDPSKLTTHRFPIEQAVAAYEIIAGKSAKSSRSIGILLDYDRENSFETVVAPALKRRAGAGKIRLGLIGAGQFAKGILLPAMMESGEFALSAVSSARGLSAVSVAERYGAGYATSDSRRVLDDQEISAVIIATRHGTHSRYVIEALERGKHVFVEKPLAITALDLEAIEAACIASSGTLTVGFNRRFSPIIRKISSHFRDRYEPLTMFYRVNAGRVPLNSENGVDP